MILDLALAIDRDHVLVGRKIGHLRRAEVENGPVLRIDRPAQRLRQARPRQADPVSHFLEMLRCQPRCPECAVLFLRMLQDQKLDTVCDRRDAVADAQRQRLAAARAFLDFIGGNGFGRFGHGSAIRCAPVNGNRPCRSPRYFIKLRRKPAHAAAGANRPAGGACPCAE